MGKDVLKSVKKQLGAEVKKTEAAQQEAKTAVAKAEAQCELRVSEMRELLSRAHASIIEAEKRAVEAEERAEMVLRVHEPYEEPPPVFASSRVACVRFAKK